MGHPYEWNTAVGLMIPGDDQAHTVVVTVLDHGQPAELTGTPVGYFTRSDGMVVACVGTLDGNVASVTMDSACYLKTGPLRCVIRVQEDPEDEPGISLVDTQLYVRDGIGDEMVDPEDSFPTIRAQAEEIAELQNDMAAMDSRVDDLENVEALVANLELESNWVEHPSYANEPPRVIRKGGVVYLIGILQNTQALTFSSASDEYAVATLPEWAWPAELVVAVQQGYAQRVYTLFIQKDGTVLIARLRDGTGYVNSETERSWNISTTWLAADVSGDESEDLETLITRMEAVAAGSVRYDAAQSLSTAEKSQARSNISAASIAEDTSGLVITL